MRVKSVMLALPFLLLYGCQPEAPKPEVAAPAAMEQPATAPAMQAAPPASEAAAPAPAQQAPAPVEKAVQPVSKEQTPAVPKQDAPPPAVMEKPVAPPPVETAPASAAQAEPVQGIAEVEVKVAAPPESAVTEQEFMLLAKKNNCFACHAVAKKVVGPSFRDVAAKYRGDAGAEAWLVEKIAKGGKGVWGVMVMTPSPNLSEADRRTLAKYILSLK